MWYYWIIFALVPDFYWYRLKGSYPSSPVILSTITYWMKTLAEGTKWNGCHSNDKKFLFVSKYLIFFYFALLLWSTKLSSVQTWFWWDFDCSFFQNGFVVCLCWELLLLVIDQTTPNISFNDLNSNNFSTSWKLV